MKIYPGEIIKDIKAKIEPSNKLLEKQPSNKLSKVQKTSKLKEIHDVSDIGLNK